MFIHDLRSYVSYSAGDDISQRAQEERLRYACRTASAAEEDIFLMSSQETIKVICSMLGGGLYQC